MRILVALALAASLSFAAHEAYRPEKDQGQTEDIPYQRYFTQDAFGRRIVFYLTKAAGASEPRPLVVSILGSGADSNFLRRGDRILDAHRALRTAFDGKAVILIVEKPGVELGFHPKRTGTSDGASEEFRREYTLERWSEAVSAALRATEALPFVDRSRVLVMGHSEGGLVACRVAAMNPSVTHVASLAGGGPSRLFSLLELARAGYLYKDAGDLPDQREARLLSEWSEVLKDPESATRDFLGHPYRAWTSFSRDSCMEELLRTRARIYLAQGTEDHSVAPVTFDILRAHLLAHGRDVTAYRVVGADHGFFFSADPKRDGQSELFVRVRTWFLGE